MDMTYREISVALRYISIRENNNFARKASLHGIKIPTRQVDISKPKGFTKEEAEAAEKLMQKRMMRKAV